MDWAGQASQHEADHGEADEGCDGARVALEVASQTSIAADPGEGALDNPALGQNDKAVGLAALDDLQGPAPGLTDKLRHLWSLIARVSEDALDERERAPCAAQHVAGAVAILHVGGMDGDAQQEAERVDEDMALAARDLLARIKALRVERGAPF